MPVVPTFHFVFVSFFFSVWPIFGCSFLRTLKQTLRINFYILLCLASSKDRRCKILVISRFIKSWSVNCINCCWLILCSKKFCENLYKTQRKITFSAPLQCWCSAPVSALLDGCTGVLRASSEYRPTRHIARSAHPFCALDPLYYICDTQKIHFYQANF